MTSNDSKPFIDPVPYLISIFCPFGLYVVDFFESYLLWKTENLTSSLN